MMKEKTKKQRPPAYVVDFATALPVIDCIERLERPTILRENAVRHPLAPMRQTVQVQDNNVFRIERSYPGGLHPIRLMGRLDPDPDGGRGTWVQAAITHDSANQVMIEGLVVFLTVFLLTAILFLRLKTRALFFSLPSLLVLLWLFGMRWRALRAGTDDLVRWVRRRLYVTTTQVR